ncbi:MAG: hypothetical protein AAF578_00355 [Pseudomonadota bacterium]
MNDFDKLLSVIEAHEATAIGQDRGRLSRERTRSIDMYNGRNIEPAPEGRSQVVDWSVFETIQWIMPSLIRIFASKDEIVEFDPIGPDDEEAAKQESSVLNHQIMSKVDWFMTCYTWFQDALLTKNAYIYAEMAEVFHTESEYYENQTEEQIALLLQEDVQVTEQEPVPTGEAKVMNGQPVIDQFGQPVEQINYNVTIRRTRPQKKLQFTVFPPERCKVSSDDFALNEADYFEYSCEKSLSDLRKEGINVPDDISGDYDYQTEEEAARNERYEDYRHSRDLPSPELREVTVRYVWVRYDFDGDGIAEMQHCIVIGKQILFREDCSTIPVACIVPFIMTHRHEGISVADCLADITRIKTKLLRGGLDSLEQSVNPRHAINENVHVDDLLRNVPGGVVRTQGKGPVANDVMPLQTEFVFPQAQQGIEHMDRMIESRVGVNRMFQGIDASASNDHDRVGQLSTMASQRVEMIARMFGHGVQRLFKIAHELLIKSGHEKETLKLNGQWITVNPSEWKTGRDMRVVAPFSAGNKDALLNRLMMIANFHEKALQGGLPIVTAQDSYELSLEIADAAGVSGDKFFTDPSTIPPPEPGPDYTAIALEVEDKKVNQREVDSQRDAEMAKYKADLDAEMEQFKARLSSETQLAIAELKENKTTSRERMKLGLEDERVTSEALDNVKSEVSEEISRQIQGPLMELSNAVMQIGEMVHRSNGPKRVIRDQNGEMIGVESVS